VVSVESGSMRRLIQSFYRLVGLAFALLGGWVLFINLVEAGYSGWVRVWVLSAGLFGALGGVTFLLSFDGPEKLKNRRTRLLGWLGILYLALLPWSFQFVMLPLAMLLIPALNMRPGIIGTASPNAGT
jgi:hypothetical protein